MRQTAYVLVNRLLARGKFRHVQLLLKLAELGSVQRTADAIGMTQPSVTQTLAGLEELLGVQLFERHARGVRPTAACLDVLPAARQMFLGIAETAEVVMARHSTGKGIVRLLASASALQGLLLRALPEFLRGAPHAQVQLREAENDDLLLAITRGEVDLVVCRRPTVIPEGWAFHALEADQLVVVCDPGHRLARRRRLAWSNVQDETWLLSPAGSIARSAFDAVSASFNAAARTYPLVTRVLAMMLHLLREERLLSLLPRSIVRPLVDSGAICVLPLPAVAMEPIGLLAPREGLREVPLALFEFLQTQSPA
ncbi:LysR family transcriptional regulator [Ramlibacter sp. G-1-2-2]|uniref:LysR family transcriptional regulator n=1 Tax=Ramlibacter agri TaxID=2728837 RepID=A0A848H3K8_9BURK|nr:LysR family transcriptional regulator [Ramlibacter agri]NML44141.1 LysR family transcriptional regulator [Ramlibacter agri]